MQPRRVERPRIRIQPAVRAAKAQRTEKARAAIVHGRATETDEYLLRTGIKIPNLKAKIRHMSGGQRQCVAISRAATFASKLIIMDEPTAALGVQETSQVENIIRNLKKRGIPLILISHNLRQVFDLVDRIWVFRRGRIVGAVDRDKTSGNEVVSLITGITADVSGEPAFA